MNTPSFNYEDWEERIIAYLNNKMTDADLQAFEKSMAEMPELQEAVEFDAMLKSQADEHFLTEYVKANWEDIMGDTLQNDITQQPKVKPNLDLTKSPNPLSIKAFLKGLGIIVVVASVLFFAYQYFSKPSLEKRLEEVMTDFFPPLEVERTTDLNDEALKLYSKGNYKDAEQLFLKTDSSTRNEDGAYGLYRAINALMINPPNTAIALDILKKRKQAGDYTFNDNAVPWYLVLAYLKRKDYENAKVVLRDIPTTSEYSDNAVKLLKILQD